jgi:hypothetical protein
MELPTESLYRRGEGMEKCLPVRVVMEDRLLRIAASRYVIAGACVLEAQWSGHLPDNAFLRPWMTSPNAQIQDLTPAYR